MTLHPRKPNAMKMDDRLDYEDLDLKPVNGLCEYPPCGEPIGIGPSIPLCILHWDAWMRGEEDDLQAWLDGEAARLERR